MITSSPITAMTILPAALATMSCKAPMAKTPIATIWVMAATQSSTSGTDRLVFGAGITVADITVARVEFQFLIFDPRRQ